MLGAPRNLSFRVEADNRQADLMVSRKENPFLTCIVCAFNEGAAIGVSLNSLINQSFTDFEVLIIDDGAMRRPDPPLRNSKTQGSR